MTAATSIHRRRGSRLRRSLTIWRDESRGVRRTVASTDLKLILHLDELDKFTLHDDALRLLTVLAEHARECHVLRADMSALMKGAIARHGAPEFIRSDNGAEFIAQKLQRWLAEERIKTLYLEPASPWQNGFVESFHGRFRDACLNREQLWTLTEARVVIEDFRIKYNTV